LNKNRAKLWQDNMQYRESIEKLKPYVFGSFMTNFSLWLVISKHVVHTYM